MSKFQKFINLFLVTLFIVLFITNVTQVFFRYVLESSLLWSEELAKYLFVWCTFLGMALNTRDKDHIVIDIFSSFSQDRTFLKVFNIIGKIISIIILIVFLYFSYDYVSTNIFRDNTSPAMRLPMWIPTLSLVIGSFLSVLFLLFQKDKGRGDSE